MAEKVVLHYINARGKMESIRWLLAVAEVEFDEVFLTSRAHYEKLVSDGDLMFQQVPMVEMDGMKLVQTKAILNYIADKYNLNGTDLKDRVMINMYSEGLMDLMEMIIPLPFSADPKPKLDNIQTKAKERYLPVFEKALSGPIYLVGGKLSRADVQLLECTLMLEEILPGILAEFRNIKSFQGRMTRVPAISKFLQPGSKRKPQPDDTFIETVKEEQFGDGPFLFVHDCSPDHKERSIKTWMSQFGVEELDWPAQSPDLNPTEQLWDELEWRLRARPPRPTSVSDLTNALLEE